MNLFLDTEWADPQGQQLVSLALISEDGEQVFYAERDPLPATPTGFVRDVVYPLLDRGWHAMDDRLFTTRLRKFLGGMDHPCVIVDHGGDAVLLQYALSGFNLTDAEAAACGPIPRVEARNVAPNGTISMLIEDWFEAHPNAKARRHHAKIDTEALRMACLGAWGKIEPDWSMTWSEYRKTWTEDEAEHRNTPGITGSGCDI